MASKWEPRFKRKKTKAKPSQEVVLCRILPPRLAAIPSILEWLHKPRSTYVSTDIDTALRLRNKEIGELINSLAKE